MSKVIEVKFLRVPWTMPPQKGATVESEAMRRGRGLDVAHSELEDKISDLLKIGWVMVGDVTYICPDKAGNGFGYSYLVQKMVKYDEEKPEIALGIRRKTTDSS